MSWWLRLLERPSKTVLLVLTGMAAAGVHSIGGRMRATGIDIIAFEFVWTPERARALLSSWGPPGQAAARESLRLDFPFIAAYATLLMCLVLLAARASSGRLRRLGAGLALMPWLAGLLDAIENVSLLRILATPEAPSAFLTGLAGAAAAVKFALVLGCALYVLVAGGAWLARLARGR